MEFDELLKTVASNIKAKRKALGLTQKSMSDFGLGQRHIQDIESGKGNLTLRTLWKLSKAFGGSVDDFLKEKTTPEICEPPVGAHQKMIAHLPLLCTVWQVGKQGTSYEYHLAEANEKAEKQIGASLREKKGQSILEIFPELENRGILEVFGHVVRTGKAAHLERVAYADRNISLSFFDFTAVPLWSEQLLLICNDVTKNELERQREGLMKNLKTSSMEITQVC